MRQRNQHHSHTHADQSEGDTVNTIPGTLTAWYQPNPKPDAHEHPKNSHRDSEGPYCPPQSREKGGADATTP